VLVGRGTVKVDDPRLTIALSERSPRRIVLASTLDVPDKARVLDGGPPTLVIGVDGRVSPDAIARVNDAGAETRLVSADPQGRVSLLEALAAIRTWGVERLLVEGGAGVLSSFLRDRLADEVTIEIVPRLLGAPGLAAVGAIGVTTLERAVVVKETRVERADGSIIVRGRLAY
jgi:diaminohydroxyphosphoribosylaminopyrimidine deaminase/5-amino-6-(5-phosphoribosylamino)uracil reductase